MSIQAGDYQSSVERISASESIHRVERETPTRDFGKKNKEHKPDHETPEEDFETPRDVVEVSGHDSHESAHKIISDTNHVLTLSHKTENPTHQDISDRHLDIKV